MHALLTERRKLKLRLGLACEDPRFWSMGILREETAVLPCTVTFSDWHLISPCNTNLCLYDNMEIINVPDDSNLKDWTGYL